MPIRTAGVELGGRRVRCTFGLIAELGVRPDVLNVVVVLDRLDERLNFFPLLGIARHVDGRLGRGDEPRVFHENFRAF